MIVIVKNQNKKRIFIKSLAIISLIAIFWLYYQHMSNKFQEETALLTKELNAKKEIEKQLNAKSIKYEETIYKEAVLITKLIQQKHIQSIAIIKDRLVITCDFGTNVEPVLIRYGANAMLKSTDSDLKLALNLETIIGNRYEN